MFQLSEAVFEHLDFKSIIVRVEDFLGPGEDFGLNPFLLSHDVKDGDRHNLGELALDDEREAGRVQARAEGVNHLKALVVQSLLQVAGGSNDVGNEFPIINGEFLYHRVFVLLCEYT